MLSMKNGEHPLKDYPSITKDISANSKTLRTDIAPTMQGFAAMAQGNMRDLSEKQSSLQRILMLSNIGFGTIPGGFLLSEAPGWDASSAASGARRGAQWRGIKRPLRGA